MLGEAKRLLGHGLVDLALILVILRQSNLDFMQQQCFDDEALEHEAYYDYDEGPSLGLVSAPTHHFQQQTPWGAPGMSQKYVEYQRDAEYEAIMRTVRSRAPARVSYEWSERNTAGRNAVTMVLSISNQASPWNRNGGVQVAHNFHVEGAVGGTSLDFPDEILDPFNALMPGNMRDDEIENLLLNEDSSDLSLSQTFPDVNWQQFIADYDSTFDNFRAPMKTLNMSFESPMNTDILTEAMQSAELFLPVTTGSQNSSEMDALATMGGQGSNGTIDLIASSRLEQIEYSEWAAQNHETDLLFPSLPPPSYDEVMATGRTGSTADNVMVQRPNNNHMHDHNYHNSSRVPPAVTIMSQNAGYAIRSRSEVSTRVISVPPRPRHISAGSDSGVSSASDTIDLTSELAAISETESVRPDTPHLISPVQDEATRQHSLSLFEIKPANSTYFDTLSKDAGLHREVILCN